MELQPYEPAQEEGDLDSVIRGAAERYDIPEGRLRAVIDAESSGNTDAVSRKGAQGLMQLMPATARELGVTDPHDPVQNIDAGARYLRQQYDRFGNWDDAHAAYNAGPTRVARGGELPQETRDYVNKINAKVGDDDAPAAPGGLDLHPYEPEDQKSAGIALHPYEPPAADEQGASKLSELVKVPTKVIGEGAAFLGGIAPMVATYLGYAANRMAGADHDQAFTAAMEARENVDPGKGLEELTRLAGVDKSWVQSSMFRDFMEGIDENLIKPASETYFPAQQSLAKTAFEDVGNMALFAAAGAGTHAAKGRVAAALPEALRPRVTEDHFEPQPAPQTAPQGLPAAEPTEAAAPAPAAPTFTDPNAQARTDLVSGVARTPEAVTPEQAPAAETAVASERLAGALDESAVSAEPAAQAAPIEHVVAGAEPIVRAGSIEEAIDAADAAMKAPIPSHDVATDVAAAQVQLPQEITDGLRQDAAEVPAESQRERPEDDHGNGQFPRPAAEIPASSPGAEDAGNYQRAAAQEIAEAQHAVQVESPSALPLRDTAEGGEGVRLEDALNGRVAGPRGAESADTGDHQQRAPEAVAEYRDFTAPKTSPSGDIVKGQIREFASEKLAAAFAKQQGLKGFVPREVEGEWRLSRPPLTDAQQANVARLRTTTATVQAHDSLATMLRKWGGINLAELTRDGVDPKDVASSLRFAYRKTGGLSLDAVAERMDQAGYDVRDEHGGIDATKAREILQGAIDGNDVYSPEGYEIRAARAAERQQAGLEPTHEELAAAGLPAEKGRQEDVSLVAQAAGLDEAHIERLAIQYGDDEAGFLRAVREFNDEQGHETAARGEAGAPAEAPPAAPAEEVDKPTALRRVGEIAERIRSADPATVVAHVRELDTARTAAVRAGATPLELIQSMETPRPRLTTQEIADVLRREPLAKKPEAPPPKATEVAPKQAPAPAGVSASEAPSIDHVPPALLNRIKVSVEQYHEGEGLKTVEVSARQALADVDAEISAIKKLLNCVGA